MAPIAWLPWSAESFSRARDQGRPVLLSIAPSWCQYSREMDRTSYADAGLAALVHDRFVPIRVDADRRPDISERYGLGAWPTTAFLTPDGQLLGGGTYVELSRLAHVLQRVADAFASGRHVQARQSASPHAGRGPSAPVPVDRLADEVMAMFDSTNGGFGDSPKFPHVAPIRLAIELYKETASQQYFDIAVKTLDAMGWGPLYDERNGGFFRYSHDADWGHPQEEKLLDVNASLLSLYVEAVEALRLARYGERAEDLLRYIQTWLADPVDGGWAGSQRADPDYYAAGDAPDRSDVDAPAVDRTLYSDWNAMMASAALQAGRVLEDPSLSQFAIKSLERVLLLGYRPGAGVAHYVEDGTPQIRGLLDDQVWMAAANLDAFEATGNVVYQMMAEELALHATRTMWDGEGDGFFDRVSDPRRDIGLLKQPVKPFVLNCLASRLLRRIAGTSESSEHSDYADRALAAVAGRAAMEGPLAAEYVLAARQPAQR